MYAVTGITGQVGGATARALLTMNQPVRAVVRDPAKAEVWVRMGVDVAVADFNDPDALESAFRDVLGVFVMIPPNFAPSRGFPESRAVIETMFHALSKAAPPKVVCLSSVGAHQTQALGLITALHLLEEQMNELDIPVTYLRAAWFMENTARDLDLARSRGFIDSYLQPLDRVIPMVATADVGRIAAAALTDRIYTRRIFEIEGPRPISPNDIASTLGHVLGRYVEARPVPRVEWESIFHAQGTEWAEPRIQMLDGFNRGWIDFENDGAEHYKGTIQLEQLVLELVKHDGHPH